MTITVKSGGFSANEPIPETFTEDGKDISPPLSLMDVPPEAKELALIMDDPDAPRDEPWVHWVLYKVSPEWKELPEGIDNTEMPTPPEGARQGRNSWDTIGYRGPAPPKGHGVHHYHFKVYALDEELSVEPGLDKTGLLSAMEGHILAQGELIGTYER